MKTNTVFFNSFVIGEGTLPIQCIKILLEAGHNVLGVLSKDHEVCQWAKQAQLPFYDPSDDLHTILSRQPFNYLFSIVNPTLLPSQILNLPTNCAINYHDALLPKYAGVHATTWALLHQEKEHGITWHVMAEQVDAGEILRQSRFLIGPKETVFTLNSKCYEAAIESFSNLINDLANGAVKTINQDLTKRSYFSKYERPSAGAIIQWQQSAKNIDALCRSLHFSTYPNPLCEPKFALSEKLYIIKELEIIDVLSNVAPGTLISRTNNGIRVATTTKDVIIKSISNIDGSTKSFFELYKNHQLLEGETLPSVAVATANRIDSLNREFAKHESFWQMRLRMAQQIDFPYLSSTTYDISTTDKKKLSLSITAEDYSFFAANNYSLQHSILTLFVIYISRLSKMERFDLSFRPADLASQIDGVEHFFATELPLAICYNPKMNFRQVYDYLFEQRHLIEQHLSYAKDLVSRTPKLQSQRDVLQFIYSEIAVIEIDKFINKPKILKAGLTLLLTKQTLYQQETALEKNHSLIWGELYYDLRRIEQKTVDQMANHLQTLLAGVIANPELPIAQLPILTFDEQKVLLHRFNDTEADFPSDKTIIDLFEEQVEKTPHHIALGFEGKDWTYQQLNQLANRIAHYLIDHYAIKCDDVVALLPERTQWMPIGILAILKSGAAYLPLSKDMPVSRLVFMLKDSGAKLLLTDAPNADLGKQIYSQVLVLDQLHCEKTNNPNPNVNSSNLVFVLYTSGSSGKPKGVLMPHQSLVNLIIWNIAYSPLAIGSRTTQFASFIFDASFHEIFATWLSGGELVMIGEEVKKDLFAFADLIVKEKIERLFLPFAALQKLAQILLDYKRDISHLKVVQTAGEQLQIGEAIIQLFKRLPDCQLENHYGPTEAHVVSAYTLKGDPTSWMSLPPIGQPIANTQLYILTNDLIPVPIGVIGELYIGGVCLARGYLNLPELTKACFIAHPFKKGERLYKTGDLARYLPDGNVEYLGRIDNQLKIRGYRVEAGEIEHILLEHPGISNCVVVGKKMSGTNELIAYIMVKEGLDISLEGVRAFLQKSLPDYMIPAYFVELDSLPLTSSGKVNRKALPAPDSGSLASRMTYVSARNPIEQTLMNLWEELLGRSLIGIHDNFFAMGGHSLRAIRLVSLIQQQLGAKIKLTQIFTHPTIAELAREVRSLATLHPSLLKSIPPTAAAENYALSNAQRRLWVIDQMEEEQIAYNMPAAIRLNGELDKQALELSIQLLFQRHESLRTNFVEGRQVIHPRINFSLKLTDYRGVDFETIQSHIQRHAAFPFDLSRDVLLQLELLQLGTAEHILLFNMHHIISDGWSMGILFKELDALYEACKTGIEEPLSVLTPLAIQYKDYSAWQNELLESEQVLQLREYWRKTLAPIEGALPILELPTDYPRPAIKTYNGASISTCLSPTILAKLQDLSQSKQATLFMSLMAVVNVLLYRYTGQKDILLGSPITGRNHPDLDEQIGFYVNTLVLRNQIDPTDSFITFLDKVKTNSLVAFENELYPFDKLVEELDLPRDTSRSAVFDVMVVLQNNEAVEFKLGDLDLKFEKRASTTSQFDLSFDFAENEKGLHLDVEYNTDLFKEDSIQRMVFHLETLVGSVLANPSASIDELNILPAAERQLLLEGFNDTKANFPSNKTIIDLFEDQVEKTPANLAIVFEQTELTYRQLNEKANQVGHYLRTTYDIRPDDIFALQLERSEWMIIAILGVMKAGAAYLPIALDAPKSRVVFMLQDSKAKALLTDKANYPTAKALESILPVLTIEGIENKVLSPSVVRRPWSIVNDLAYIIYTSGSTGQPKGVMIEHKSVVNLIEFFIPYLGITSKDRILQTSSYTFDSSVAEIFMPFFCGATLILVKRMVLLSPTSIQKYLNSKQVTYMDGTPALLASFNKTLFKDLRSMCIGGEVANMSDVRFYAKHYNYFNDYGPTECTVTTTIILVSDKQQFLESAAIPIGKPIANTQVYILDVQNQPVPIGLTGQLYISGVGLARGYLNNPELTEEKFIPHPFIEGERLYKSGDLARWLPDGNIEFLGRIDHQLKIRGFRIEAGEIEQTLLTHPLIQSAVVIAYEIDNNKELVVYLVSKEESVLPDIPTLHSFLAESLPDYMIPAYFVGLDSLPLTSSGKVNRKALPAPDSGSLASRMTYVSARNPIEQTLMNLWEELLGRSLIGIHDNFFAMGGHSLRAIRLVSLIQQQLGAKIKLTQIFTHPTIAELAREVRSLATLHPSLLKSIPPTAAAENYALSNAQRRLWVIDQMEEEQIAYNMPAAIRLNGELDKQALELSIQLLFQRHESLRTNFVEGRQVIHPRINFSLKLTDYRGVDFETIQSHIQRHAAFPFDLSRDVLLQLELLQLGTAEHILLFNMHHIISDGWSMGILFKELDALYEACKTGIEEPLSVLTPLAIQYKDYSAWQNELLESEQVLQLREYWRKTLAPIEGALPILELPTDYPRPAIKTYNGASISTCLSPTILAKLQDLSQSKQATLFMSLMAVVNVLLYRYTGQKDILLGSPITGRNHPDLDEQIGFYVNTLVLRNQIDPTDSFITFLDKVKTNSLVAFENELYPFDKLVEELDLPRDTSRSAVFDVMVVLQNNEAVEFKLGDLDLKFEKRASTTSQFDLSFDFAENEKGLHLDVEYNTDLFKEDSIQRMVFHLETLVGSVLANPSASIDELNILPAAERQLLLEGFNDTKANFPSNKTIIDLFEDQVEKTPANLAIVFEQTELTYRQLNEKANQVGHYLRTTYDIRPDDIFALQLERSEWMIIAILGVMKAGAAYLPIALDAPKSRVVFMLQDSKAKALLTDKANYPTAKALESILPVLTIEGIENKVLSPSVVRRPWSIVNDLAYIIYTSGSTGQPKGVMIEHKSVVNLIEFFIPYLGITSKDRILQTSSYTFDSSVAEIFMPFFCGATLILVKRMVLLSPTSIQKYLNSKQVTYMDGTPALLASFNKTLFKDLRSMCIGGEVANMSDVRFYAKHYNYFNDYGPTECTVTTTIILVSDKQQFLESAAIPIGKPIANTQVYILDVQNQPVPIGLTGQLYISGVGLARGYLNNPELTEEKFIPHPFIEGERLYKSGDLARWLPDGNIEFLGRIDHQLKIRGFRIEAGEIETVLQEIPQVEKAVVVARANILGDKQLVAYLVLNQYETPNYLALRSFLKQKLPGYMIPAAFVPLDAIPLTTSGKVNRKALPAPDRDRQFSVASFVSPTTPIQIQLATIWKEVLFLDSQVGLHDDFFDLGGHSLLAIQLVSRIEKAFQFKIPLHQLFKIGSVAEIAKLLETTEDKEQYIQKKEKTTSIVFTPLAPEIYRQLLIYTSAWQGKRVSPQSLLSSLNTTGTRPALYWCFQGFQEFNQLSKYLGEDQPVYGMRSGHEVMQYTAENVKNLSKHYANEIVEVDAQGPYILGGNCQSGFIAYEISLELTRRGKMIHHVFILESLYSPTTGEVESLFLSCPDTSPMTFIFGEKSRFNPYFYHQAPANSLHKYLPRGFDFEFLPCDHGQYFQEPNVQLLATIIQTQIRKISQLPSGAIEKDLMVHSAAEPWSKEAYKAKLTLSSILPKEVNVEDILLLEIVIQNQSMLPWIAGSGLGLGNHWYNELGDIIQWFDGRVLLEETLNPGETTTLSLQVNVPNKPGKHILEVDLVEEGITWFKSKGNTVIAIEVKISRKTSPFISYLKNTFGKRD